MDHTNTVEGGMPRCGVDAGADGEPTLRIESRNSTTLVDGRAGFRALVEVTCSESSSPTPAKQPTMASPARTSQPSTLNSQPVLDFVASSATLDRYNEIIEPAGWRLDSYARNPVFQNAHNYGDIIFTLGKAVITEVRSVASGVAHLFQRIEFATEVNPMARIAYGLYKGGFLRAVSVGFIPIRWENGAPESPFRRKYLEQELLEVSAVAIPANPDALALGLKAGAVRKSDVSETLDLVRLVLDDSKPLNPQPSTLNLLNFARSLRRIMRA